MRMVDIGLTHLANLFGLISVVVFLAKRSHPEVAGAFGLDRATRGLVI